MSRRNVVCQTITASTQIFTGPGFFNGMVIAPSGVGDPTAGAYDGVAADQGTVARMCYPELEYDGTKKVMFGGLPGVFVRTPNGLYVYISGNATVTVYYSI